VPFSIVYEINEVDPYLDYGNGIYVFE